MKGFRYILLLFMSVYSHYVISQNNPSNQHSPFGVNLSAIDPWESDWTFVNIAHHSLAWHPVEDVVEWHEIIPKNMLTPEGYIPGGMDGILSIVWDSPRPISNVFILTWEGDATAEIHNQWSSPQLISASDHRLEFRMNNDSFLFIKFTNNTLAKPIKNIRCVKAADENNQNIFSSGLTDFVKHFKVIRFTHFTNTNNSTVTEWSDIPRGHLFQNNARYSDNRVDFRFIPQLCNELNIDPWISIPLNASDAFINSLVEEVFPLFDKNLSIYTELSNEVWNTIFSQHQEAAQKARNLNLSNTGNSWEDAPVYYGHRSAQMHQLIDTKMAEKGITNKHCKLIAWQSANSFFLTTSVLPAYEAEAVNNQKPELIAIAPFFGGELGSPENEPVVETWNLDQLFRQLEFGNLLFINGGSIPALESELTQYQEVAAENGISGVVCYEMGQHLVGYGGVESNETITNLFNAANRDARMKNMYVKYFDLLKENNIQMHGLFSTTSLYNKWGSWGLKEFITQSDAPKFDAVLDFKSLHPVNWNDCQYSFTSHTNDSTGKLNFNIFPNPVDYHLNITDTCDFCQTWYYITSSDGALMTDKIQVSANEKIDVSLLNSGLYVLHLITSKDTQNFKFIKM